MKPQKVSISTPNKMFFIKGKLIRSPLTTIINTENELLLLESSMKNQDVKYNIEEYIKKEKVVKPAILEAEQIEIFKEKKKQTAKTTLEKIAESE